MKIWLIILWIILTLLVVESSYSLLTSSSIICHIIGIAIPLMWIIGSIKSEYLTSFNKNFDKNDS